MSSAPEKTVNTTIEILGKTYPIRCLENEVSALQQAALFLNQQMKEVQDSGKAINVERIAIITALNIAFRFLQADAQKNTFSSQINQRIAQLQDKLESVLGSHHHQAEFAYSAE